MGIIFAILIFSFIVAFHEFGHFIVAKANKIQVFDFSLGFGPSLVHKKIGETTYNIRPIPLGGFCQMGEDDGRGNFNDKPAWRRALVIAAGPAFNLILAFLLAILLVGIGGYSTPKINKVEKNLPAAEAGLKSGDTITAINNHKIHVWGDILTYNALHQGETVAVHYTRNGKAHVASITPKKNKDYYILGISKANAYTKATPLTAIQYGYYNVKSSVYSTWGSLAALVTGKLKFNNLSGPLGIGELINNSYKSSKPLGAKNVFLSLLSIAVLLSANLGIMNLLPIPALDGGRLVFIGIEGVRRKRVNQKYERIINTAGMALLFTLMIVITIQDFIRGVL